MTLTTSELTATLRATAAPGEPAARARAHEVAHAALRARPAAAPRRLGAAVLAPVLAALFVLAAAFSPAGAEVSTWVADNVRQVVGAGPAPQPADEAQLPGGGRLLAAGAALTVAGAAAVSRVAGRVDEASWSVFGRYVAATRGNELLAFDLAGHRRWTVDLGVPLATPRWSPDGQRVAFEAGGTLAVVAGDGTGARRLGVRPAPGALAWRPGADARRLAVADRQGRVRLLDPDSGRELWRSKPQATPHQLAWSADGSRLVALSPGHLHVLSGASGSVIRRERAPAGTRNVAVAFARRGSALAIATRRGAETQITLAGRLLLGLRGRVRDLAWSPDGRWLAVAPEGASSWYLLRPRGSAPPEVRTLARQGRLAGWCCPA